MNSLQWFQVIVSFAVQATLVINVAWGVEKWNACAVVKARVWTACFVSLLLMLAMGVVLPRLEWFHPWSALGPKKLLEIANLELVLGKRLLAIWGCGSAVMIARWVMQFLSVRAFIARCAEYPPEVQTRLRSEIPADVTAPHAERLCFRESPRELGPFCYQFHQPLIFLPKTLVDGDKTEREHVLRHELTDLQTQHPLQLFVQKLAQVVLWFHPLVWMGGRRSSLVREFVCDDAASGDAQSTASYLRTLLRLVESRSTSPAGSLMFGRSQCELKLRVRRLAFKPDRPQSVGWRGPVAVFATALLLSQLWLPTNPLSSRRATYSPWPNWTATVAHAFGVHLRDFEAFDADLEIGELLEAQRHGESS